jgi:hypothetical protein
MENVTFYYIHGCKIHLKNGKKKTIFSPAITVCLAEVMINFEKYIIRGVAICSAKDNPYKKEGRKHAYEMAELAEKNVKELGIFYGYSITISGYVREAMIKYGLDLYQIPFNYKASILKEEYLLEGEKALLNKMREKRENKI